MSNLAEMTHECETCGVELRYHGGPHRPRWCAEHRDEGWKRAHAQGERRVRAVGDSRLKCAVCRARLLRPSSDNLCGFCRVEVREAV